MQDNEMAMAQAAKEKERQRKESQSRERLKREANLSFKQANDRKSLSRVESQAVKAKERKEIDQASQRAGFLNS